MAVVGAAPIAGELVEFFDACGVLLLEGYGMTETCSIATFNPARRAPPGHRRASAAGVRDQDLC